MFTNPDGVRPIEVNAGGIVPAAELIGRQDLEAALLACAAAPSHGAVLLGDRRIGKTSLLRTIEEPLRQVGHLVVRVSAETASLDKFAAELLAGLRTGVGRSSWALELSGEAGISVGIGRVTLRGTASRGESSEAQDLFLACALAARRAGGGRRVVFLLDEITVLASELARSSPADAREFLRTLRKARQELPEVVMFLAGSIGLHHALADRTVVNDLTEMHVDVLSAPDALTLARGLILGADLDVDDELAVAHQMVAQTSGFPYYLHGVAQLLALRGGRIGPAEVRLAFQEALDADLWSTSRYDSRLDEYYGQHAELVRDLLDAIACADVGPTLAQLAQSPAVAQHEASRTDMLDLLRRLEADHYLRRSGSTSTMASELIGRIWRHQRRLQ